MSAWFEAPSLSAGARLVGRIVELIDGGGSADQGGREGLPAERALPEVDLRAGGVRIRIGGLGADGAAEVKLARGISGAARELGLTADPAALQEIRVVVDAGDKASVMSFWRTALGYEAIAGDGLGDPLRRDPDVRFRHLQDPRPLRNRIHVDIGRVPEAVEEVRAAVGQEPYGPYGFTLADVEGNEIDLVPGGRLSEAEQTADWRVPFGGMTFYPTASAAQVSELAAKVARLADDAGWPLLVDVRPDGVTIDSAKDQWEDEQLGEIRFAELAGRIQRAARGMGLSAEVSRLRFVQLALDAVDVAAVRGFWRELLGYRLDERPFVTDIYDPRRLNPVILFQGMDGSEEGRRRQRNRICLDLLIPGDQVEGRIAAALAAGGRLVDDQSTRGRLLADPEGNEVRIRT